jgi:competence protein ComEA
MTLDVRDRLALAVAAIAVVLLGAAAYLAFTPIDAGGTTDPGPAIMSDAPLASASAAPAAGAGLVVDVEGGVARPGIVNLPADARVADAIRAAGGYAHDADLAAAARSLNLAAALSDGAQVYVPIIGMPGASTPAEAGGGDGAGGGPVNLNTASAAALESLPGIGPVTAAKIIAARQEAPFETLDELVDRKVMNRGQLDGIRDLVTI